MNIFLSEINFTENQPACNYWLEAKCLEPSDLHCTCTIIDDEIKAE